MTKLNRGVKLFSDDPSNICHHWLRQRPVFNQFYQLVFIRPAQLAVVDNRFRRRVRLGRQKRVARPRRWEPITAKTQRETDIVLARCHHRDQLVNHPAARR